MPKKKQVIHFSSGRRCGEFSDIQPNRDIDLVSTREGLEQLRSAIDKALTGTPGLVKAYAGDGERYEIRIALYDFPKQAAFETLVKELRKRKATVEVKVKATHLQAYAEIAETQTMDGVNVLFSTPAPDAWFPGLVMADNATVFDKWSKSYLRLPLPESETQLAFLLEQLQFLRTEEGYDRSNKHEFVDKYPPA